MFQCFNEFIEVNGCKQFLSIRSTGRDKPILLYLHGGPGDAALPLISKCNSSLTEYFTVAIWEQRGTGKSYYPFRDEEKVTISLFLKDVYAIIAYLLDKFKQEKIYLVGHSWGSVLGLKFCQLYPEKIHTYIGCGQVVNMKKSSRLAYEYAIQEAKKDGNTKALDKLKNINCSYSSENWVGDLLFVTGLVVKYKGSLYGHKNYNCFVKDFIFSKEYSLTDLIHRQKGSLQSIQRLWQELMSVDFEGVKEIPVPVVFVEGRHDYHVSSTLAKEYFDTITTPKEFFWFENSCHFPQWSEAEKFSSVLRFVILNEYKIQQTEKKTM